MFVGYYAEESTQNKDTSHDLFGVLTLTKSFLKVKSVIASKKRNICPYISRFIISFDLETEQNRGVICKLFFSCCQKLKS